MNIKRWVNANEKWILASLTTLIIGFGGAGYLLYQKLQKEIDLSKQAIETAKQALAGNFNDPTVREILLKQYNLESLVSEPSTKELFKLDDFDNVDISEKTIRIDVDGKFFSAFGDEWDSVLKDVLKFYASGRIQLDFEIVDSINYQVLEPGKHIAIVVLDAEEFNKLADEKTYGTAELPKNVCYFPSDLLARVLGLQVSDISKKLEVLQKELTDILTQEKEGTISAETSNENTNPLPNTHFRLSTILLHELAHLFGLYHSNNYVNDTIPNKSDGLPNCMKPIEFESDPTKGCLFEDVQMKLMHSYLSGGKVFQAYKLVGFDTRKYNFLIGYVNNYNTP
ncbi:hypothetical protein HY636_05500 [Candidatus Woesearchaeota archaeon]|nr:hypothetical protein [Candidatus Woesearchaeota archaeon]